MSDKVTVAVRNLSKNYSVQTESGSRMSLFRHRRTEVAALRGVTFVARSGEAVGILGKNGSGKSTLMRLLAGGESPSSGTVLVSAQPTLLGVAAALQSHLTGISNVRLGLLAMGLPVAQVDAIKDSVAEWADIGDAVERPLKTYSSGMKARLKFAIATAVQPEILLIDEALSTGDATFAERAKERMDSFLAGAGTVFLVSHGSSTIQQHCSRAIWLHEGAIVADGDSGEVSQAYRLWSQRVANGDGKGGDEIIQASSRNYVAQRVLFDSETVPHFEFSKINSD